MANEPNNDKLILAMGLIAKQAGSGKSFSFSDFCRDLDITVPQFFIERRMFTFSAQRYEIEVKVGGRGRDQREWPYLPDELRNLLTEYKTTSGTTKRRRFMCYSDNRAKTKYKKQRFLLAKTNFKGSRIFWSKAVELLRPYGFQPATAMELLRFSLMNDRMFKPDHQGNSVSICSLDTIRILKGNHPEKEVFLHLEHQDDPVIIKETLMDEPCLDGINKFFLIKEIDKK